MFKVQLTKERFKFAAAHFTIFGPKKAERLHGHQYRVFVLIYVKSLSPKTKLAIDVQKAKQAVDKACAELDERCLLPSRSPFVTIARRKKNFEITFADRFYSLPVEDCKLLPTENISSEALAEIFYEKLLPRMKALGASRIKIGVQESEGQTFYFDSASDSLTKKVRS